MTKFQLSNQKQYCLRWIFEAKAVLLLTLKQYCFWSIFEAKAVLLLVHFWSKSSAKWKKKNSVGTVFSHFLRKKQYCFCSIIEPKAALLYPNFWTKSCCSFQSNKSLSLVFVVQSGNVIPFFASTEPQQFNYDIGVRNKTRHCALRHILRPDMYLWCLWSNLGMWHQFLHLQNLSNSIMTLACTIKRGIVL